MQQEAAAELVRRECHDALPLGTIMAVVLVAEGDAGLVERNETPVRDGDPVSIAREIGEHGLGAGERRLGIDHEPLLPDCSEVTQKNSTISETSLVAEEGKSSGCVELDQPDEEQAAEEHAQHPHWQEEGRTRRYPAQPVKRDAAARHDHVDVRMVCHRRSGGDADAGAEVLRVSCDRRSWTIALFCPAMSATSLGSVKTTWK